MKRMEEPEKDNSQRWMLTYLDLITLLMVFFVLMYAMSSIDTKKYTIVSKSLNMALGGGTGYVIGSGGNSTIDLGNAVTATSTSTESNDQKLPADSNSMELIRKQLDNYLNDEKLNNDVIVEVNERGLDVRLKDSILFDSGKADIKESSRNSVIKIGKILNKIDGYIRVEGYTDNVPIKNQSYSSNWQLSAIRATNVVELLIGNAGIEPGKISAVGYGEYRPIADNSTPDGRAKNRRVEIVIMNSKFDNMESN